MIDLLILGATAISEERLLEDLGEAITEYKNVPSEHNQKKMLTICMMLVVKHETGDNLKKAIEMTERMEKQKELNKLFKTEEN